jgi:hypothetical protein
MIFGYSAVPDNYGFYLKIIHLPAAPCIYKYRRGIRPGSRSRAAPEIF